MRIHAIIEHSKVNGPGTRFVVWLQGCTRNCPGCFNPETHAIDGGYESSTDDIVAAVPDFVDGITVSGGEPFDQEKELSILLSKIKNCGKTTLVYTGYTYEELSIRGTSALQYCDYLIDGAYCNSIPPISPWTGSGNQRFLELKHGVIYKDLTCSTACLNGNFIDLSDTQECSTSWGEIVIDKTGTIISTGIFDGRL